MKLTTQQIQHIANLAYIELNEKEIEKFQKELSLILDWVEQLSEVDTNDIEPMGQVTGLCNVMRKDKVKSQISNIKSQILKNAPMREDGYIKTRTPL